MKDLVNNSYERYSEWLKKSDESLRTELEKIKGNENEIIDRFYKDLEFGTGGLRGKIGAGSNRMNVNTVGKATQGLANYLLKNKKFCSAVIAFDTRLNSELFAKKAAEVFAANNIQVYMFREPTATPILSFAVRELKADCGIVITASHNPPIYNGYKVYTSDGTQAVPHFADAIIREINYIDYFNSVKIVDFENALNEKKIKIIENEIFDSYIDKIEAYMRTLKCDLSSKINITYTPLYGTGFKPVMEILKRIGFTVYNVEEQSYPDPKFPTIKVPNPEEKDSFKMALDLAQKNGSEVVFATDPDSDRIGVYEKNGDEYITFNGNEIGIMLCHFLLEKMKNSGQIPENGLIIKTIVSTDMIKPIVKEFGVDVEETLTGFKFIGEKIEFYKQNGEKKFIFGFEESYGYLANDHARDKDAVIASAMIACMASELHASNKTMGMYLEELSQKYGYYREKLLSFEFDGIDGLKKISDLMGKMRNEPPIIINSKKLFETLDYTKGLYNLPVSDVIELKYDGLKILARPSGTEPKIKFYIMANGKTLEEALQMIKGAESAISIMIK